MTVSSLSISAKATEILHLTNNGHGLSSLDRVAVKHAVNGLSGEKSINKIDAIFKYVTDGSYKPDQRWLHGIRYFTSDCDGRIFYKGNHIEKCVNPHNQEAKRHLLKMESRCLLLESLGVDVSIASVVHYWDWFEDLSAEEGYLQLIKRIPTLYTDDNGILLYTSDACFYCSPGENVSYSSVEAFLKQRGQKNKSNFQSVFMKLGFDVPDAGQGPHLPISYATGPDLITLLEFYGVPSNLFE